MGLNIKENDRILVVAPHPDDESIGCGGLLSLYGKQCDVVVITDGDNRKVVSDIADVREKEFINAVSLAEVQDYKCLRIPERQIKEHKNKISEIDFGEYQHVFVPNRNDVHKDHMDTYQEIKKNLKKNCNLYEYEVWSPLRKPNIYLDISAVAMDKMKMIKMHESQMKELDYVGMIMGLNTYRGRSHQMEFAECFYCEKKTCAKIVRKVKRRIRRIFSVLDK